MAALSDDPVVGLPARRGRLTDRANAGTRTDRPDSCASRGNFLRMVVRWRDVALDSTS
jgi:hypothetical protein